MDERTQKLIDTHKAQGPLTTGQIGDVFATTKAPSEIPTPTPVPTTQKAPNLPEPQAQKIQENFVASLSKQAENARKTLEDTYKIQREALDREKEALEIKQQGYLSQIDPETRPTYEQETRIMQNQLDASEAASKTLRKNFEEKQKLVDELDTLLTQGNQLIEQQRMASTSISAGNQMMQITLRDVAARTGVIEAVLSARDGQIGQAHNIINLIS